MLSLISNESEVFCRIGETGFGERDDAGDMTGALTWDLSFGGGGRIFSSGSALISYALDQSRT